MNKKSILLNICIAIAIAVSIFYIKKFMDSSTREIEKTSDHTPDAYMINASYLRTDEKGQRDVIVFSPVVTHFKEKDASHFKQPEIKYYKNGESWFITAKKATGLNGTEQFYLHDDVRIKQQASRKSAGTTLLTQTLTVFPKRNLVTTKDFVTIEQPGLKISAVGLRGDLNTGNIQLLSKTRGQYDPKQPH